MLLHQTPIKLARFLRRKTFFIWSKSCNYFKRYFADKSQEQDKGIFKWVFEAIFSHVNTTEIFE